MKTRVPLEIVLAAGMAAVPAFAQTPLNLLNQLQRESLEASSDAVQLQAEARSNYLSWEADADTLNSLKADINGMGQTLARLEQMRASETPEERQACDEALPLLKKMAGNTSAAVRFLNEYQGRFWQPPYQSDVANLAGEASRLKKDVGLYTKLANDRASEKQIETTLGSEAGS